MAKKNKRKNANIDEDTIWVQLPKIVKVHIVSNGILTICKATLEDESTTFYNWDSARDREYVRKTVSKDAEIIVDKNVFKGWDYGKQ